MVLGAVVLRFCVLDPIAGLLLHMGGGEYMRRGVRSPYAAATLGCPKNLNPKPFVPDQVVSESPASRLQGLIAHNANILHSSSMPLPNSSAQTEPRNLKS